MSKVKSTRFMSAVVAASLLASAGFALAQSTQPHAPFMPNRPLSGKYVLRANGEGQTLSFSFTMRYRTSLTQFETTPCSTTFDELTLGLAQSGTYQLEISHRFTCQGPPKGAYITRDFGKLKVTGDEVAFVHDASKDEATSQVHLRSITWNFGHHLEFMGIQDVKEVGVSGRSFEALVVRVDYKQGPPGPAATTILVLVPSEAGKQLVDDGQGRRRDLTPGEKAWMPGIRTALATPPTRTLQPGSDCSYRTAFPDSFSLVSTAEGSRFKRVGWLRIGDVLSEFHAPPVADTVTMSFKGLRCRAENAGTGLTVLLERYGHQLEVDSAHFVTVTPEGVVSEGALRLRAAGGRLQHVMLTRTCTDASACNVATEPAEPLAAQRSLAELKRAADVAEQDRLRQARVRAEVAKEQRGRLAAAMALEARQRAAQTARFQKAGARDDQLTAALEGRVTSGMSQPLVREILGPPSREEKRVTELGTFVVWVYPTTTVEFSGGKVTTVRK